jgi:thioredoxin-related protein
MHRPTHALIAALALTLIPHGLAQDDPPAGGGTGSQTQPEKKPAPPPIYDETADAREQIDEALARAGKENRRVLIQWGANWCGWCRLLHNVYKQNGDVRRKLSYEYDLVLVDIGRWDKNMDLASGYGADLKSPNAGVPYLTILDPSGSVVTNQETASFEIKRDGKSGHDPEKLLAFFTKHQAPYLNAETILADALAEAARTDRKVFLHFGAPWCVWCHRLEQWMAGETVAEILALDFVEVKIDVDRTIGGKEMMDRYTDGKSRGIPWFAFLDGDGAALATSDTPRGNLGCPHDEQEIAAFKGILAEVRSKITDEQIDELAAGLGPRTEPAGGVGARPAGGDHGGS